MKLLFPNEPRERGAIGAWLVARGFELSADQAATWGTRWTTWERDEDAVAYVTRGAAGTAALKVFGPNEQAIAAELLGFAPARTPAELLAPPNGSSLRAWASHAFDLGTLLWLDSEASTDAKRALLTLLLDERELVRWAALEAAVSTVARETVEAIGAAAERYEDLAGPYQRVRAIFAAQEDGTFGDHDTDDRFELLSRAREGLRDGKWRRIAKAMDVLLAESPWDDEGLYLRAHAHEGEGEMLEALFLFGAAERELASSESVRRKVDEERAGDDEDLDAVDEDDDDDLVSNETIEIARTKIAALRERAGDASSEAHARIGAFVTRWLHEWEERMQVGAVYGGARALRGNVPELEALLTFIVGRYEQSDALLEEARRAAPDSPSVALAAIQRDEEEGGRQLLELRERLRARGDSSPAARSIEDFVAARGERYAPTEALLVEILAKRAYDAQKYDEAAALADELCALDPDTGLGWQLRANARIFALRHEESIAAYDDAIAALDRIYQEGNDEGSIFFGDDARPGMYFNRGCAQAKVGRKADALESLRAAIRESEKYASMAVEDDYLETLFDDPEFKAIVAREPRALRTAQEREPTWVKAMIASARDEQQAGDVQKALATAGRAAELGGFLEDGAIHAEALAILGRMQAFMGSTDVALETTARAVELAGGAGVPPDVRALVSGQRGICLQAAGDLDGAEAAYQEAFEARRAAFGEDHPVLVKSLVAIAGVALERGRAAGEVEGVVGRGIDIATRFLASSPPKDHVWAEAIDDLVSLLIRRTLLRQRAGAIADAVKSLSLAMDRLDDQRAGGFAPMAAVLEQVRSFAGMLVSGADTPELASAAGDVGRRAVDLLVPGPPEERAARLLFRNLKVLVGELRAAGTEDRAIASALQEAVRGGDGGPEGLRDIPVLAELRTVLATAAANQATVLVTAAMALQFASVPGRLDAAIEQLEDLVVPYAAMG